MNIEKLIGNTPMIKIDYEYENRNGSIYTKLEYYNYSGSIKDRIASYIIQKERENGNLARLGFFRKKKTYRNVWGSCSSSI